MYIWWIIYIIYNLYIYDEIMENSTLRFLGKSGTVTPEEKTWHLTNFEKREPPSLSLIVLVRRHTTHGILVGRHVRGACLLSLISKTTIRLRPIRIGCDWWRAKFTWLSEPATSLGPSLRFTSSLGVNALPGTFAKAVVPCCFLSFETPSSFVLITHILFGT